MYRNYRGREVFTGILLVARSLGNEDCLFKLHDPSYQNFDVGATIDDLAGHGHIMTSTEYVLEMRHYDTDENTDSREVKNATPFFERFCRQATGL
jgi:predicted SpoU family rRNA methylase